MKKSSSSIRLREFDLNESLHFLEEILEKVWRRARDGLEKQSLFIKKRRITSGAASRYPRERKNYYFSILLN